MAMITRKSESIHHLNPPYPFAPREGALAQARSVDVRRSKGQDLGPLAGIPVGVKDNLCTADMPSTGGSRVLEGYRPPYDATAVALLRAAGAVLIGKTNLDEFGMGSSTENSGYQVKWQK